MSGPTILTDEPTAQDRLDRTKYAQAFARLAETCETPMVIGLYGGWGIGKTSLMKQIQAELRPELVRTVWFDPWRHQFDESPVVALVHTVVDTFGLHDEGKKLLMVIATAFGSMLLNATTTITWQDIDEFTKRAEEERFAVRDARVRLTEYFGQLIERAKGKPPRRIVFFIDDLDRCLPSHTLTILEALKLYLNLIGCVYFLGVDRDALERSIRHHYTDVQLNEASYLDKIVQLPFAIPPIAAESMEGMIAPLLPDEIKPCLDLLVRGLGDNPRNVKRFINTLLLNHHLASSLDLVDYDPSILAVLLLIQYRNHDLYKFIARQPDLLRRLTGPSEEALSLRDTHLPVDDRLNHILSSVEIPTHESLEQYVFLTEVAGVADASAKASPLRAIEKADLESILSQHLEWVQSGGRLGRKADLREADLHGAALHAVDLREAKLSRSNLRAADLSEATLEGANLRHADGTKANLEMARLYSADMRDSVFEGANMAGANLVMVDCTNCNLSGAILNGADLRQSRLEDADIDRAELRGAMLSEVDLREVRNLHTADFRRAILQGVNLEHANLHHVRMVRADLKGANLRGANLAGADLTRSKLSGADLAGTKFDKAVLDRADVRGVSLGEVFSLSSASLQGIVLKNVDLRGAKLSGARLCGADLRGSNLAQADLAEADLSMARLDGANMEGARLQGAKLNAASFKNAKLDGADLELATLLSTDLTGASLRSAVMRQADARRSKLDHADMREIKAPFACFSEVTARDANMERADLAHAELVAADLSGANLHNALLRKADLAAANLNRVNLSEANLDEASLVMADVRDADLAAASLNETVLENVVNLTASQLFDAYPRGLETADMMLMKE